MKVFVSYSDQDRRRMKSIQLALANRSVDCIVVVDRLSPGTPLSSKVMTAIDEATHFLPILTKSSRQNQWVNQEIGYARAKGKIFIPIIASDVLDELKGFIHKQDEWPFIFESDPGNQARESRNFRRSYLKVVEFLGVTHKDRFEAEINPVSLKRGQSYTTKVRFKGVVQNGFFDNRVIHQDSEFNTWNWDPVTLPDHADTAPGILNGSVDIERTYSHSTSNWPPGDYLIHVRLYTHVTPGERGRQPVSESTHKLHLR